MLYLNKSVVTSALVERWLTSHFDTTLHKIKCRVSYFVRSETFIIVSHINSPHFLVSITTKLHYQTTVHCTQCILRTTIRPLVEQASLNSTIAAILSIRKQMTVWNVCFSCQTLNVKVTTAVKYPSRWRQYKQSDGQNRMRLFHSRHNPFESPVLLSTALYSRHELTS